MTTEQIEKLIKVGERRKLSAVDLARYVTKPPYSLCAAEATIIMEEFRRRHPVTLESIAKAHKRITETIQAAPVPKKSPWAGLIKDEISTPAGREDVFATPGYAPSILNRSAVKEYALAVSDQKRAGKFKRVSPSFVKLVEAEVECVIRDIGRSSDIDDTLPGEWGFLNRKQIISRVVEQLNRATRIIILRKVRSYPSKGQTLK